MLHLVLKSLNIQYSADLLLIFQKVMNRWLTQYQNPNMRLHKSV